MSIYRYAQIFYWPFVWRGRRRRHIDVSSNIVGCNFGWQQTMAIMIIIWPMRETSSPKVKQYQTSASARLLCSNRTPSIIARLERVANLIGRFFVLLQQQSSAPDFVLTISRRHHRNDIVAQKTTCIVDGCLSAAPQPTTRRTSSAVRGCGCC